MINREELISILVLKTGWNKSAFEKMTDKKLVEMYERYMDL